MKDSDIIAIVALVISVIINLFTFINTYKINKFNSYSNIVISERIKSLEDFKHNAASLITLLNYIILTPSIDPLNLDKVGYITKKLSYQLNLLKREEKKLIITLEKCNLLIQVVYLWGTNNASVSESLKKLFEENESILKDDFVVLYNSKDYWDKYINLKFINNQVINVLRDTVKQLDSQLSAQTKKEWEKSKKEIKERL